LPITIASVFSILQLKPVSSSNLRNSPKSEIVIRNKKQVSFRSTFHVMEKMFGSGSGMRKWSDPDPGWNIPDPQHWPTKLKIFKKQYSLLTLKTI
jgi:hypothetical protein